MSSLKRQRFIINAALMRRLLSRILQNLNVSKLLTGSLTLKIFKHSQLVNVSKQEFFGKQSFNS